MAADLFAVLDGGAVPAAPLVRVELPGPPRGKGRPRFRIVTPRFKPQFVQVYTPPETVEYERALAWKAKAAMRGREPFEGPLAVRMFAMMPIAPSWPQREKDAAVAGIKIPQGKPDIDNIAKAGLDALNGIVWRDDTQIARALIVKEYGESPGVIIEVFALP